MTERVDQLDCAVIGAGVVGLAVARELALRGREVTVLEAAAAIGTQTSSRNSEVIHAGIYYPSGSLKARLCVRGKKLLYEYCRARNIPHRQVGKLLIASSPAEVETLKAYHRQATDNGVSDLVWCSRDEIRTLEPAVACVAGLASPSTGIIDSHSLMIALQVDLENHGGRVVCNTRVSGGSASARGVSLEIAGEDGYRVSCTSMVNSAGLAAHQLAASIEGVPPASIPKLHFARGHYFVLSGASPFSRLVYPLADAESLGIHATVDLTGQAKFGPDVVWIDEPGYQFDENRKTDFVAAIKRYYPALDPERLVPGYTGVRSKLAGPGEVSADFLIQSSNQHGIPGLVNLFGIESPGLTSCLALAEDVAEAVAGHV